MSNNHQNHSYSSAFVIDPIVAHKIRETTVDPESDHDDEPILDYSEPEDEDEIAFVPPPAPVIPKSPRKFRGGQKPQKVPILSARGTNEGEKTFRSSGSTTRARNTGYGGMEFSAPGARRRGPRGSGMGGDDGPDPPPCVDLGHPDLAAARRRRRRSTFDDEDPPPPKFFNEPFDWIFRYYHSTALWQIPVIFFFIVWLVVALVFVQYFMAVREGGSIFSPGNGSIYIPPMQAPRTMDELADRVIAFEKSLGSLDYRFGKKLNEEISSLKSDLAVFSSEASNAAVSASEKRDKETSDLLKKMTAQLNTMQKNAEKDKKRIDEEIKRLKKSGTNPDAVEGLLAPKHIREEISKALRETLPSSLAATLKPDGTVEMTKGFKKAMEDLFDQFFPQRFDQNLKKATPDIIKSVPSWSEFMKDNEKRLQTTIDDRVGVALDGKTKKDNVAGAVLSKETVMMIIRDQLENYQTKWERETLYPLLDQRLDKFKASFTEEQEQRIQQLKSSILASTRKNSGGHGGWSFGGSGHKSLGLQIPDFANQLSGGHVWPYLTSPSYEGKGKGTSYLQRLIKNPDDRPIPYPGIAILPSADEGDCWPFPGNYGTLALSLSEEIFPTHVTIENIARSLSHDYTSTPKNVEIWARVRDPAARNKIQAMTNQGERPMQPLPLKPGNTVVKETKHTRDFVKLGDFVFDIDGDYVQSFELPVNMKSVGIAARVVALVFTDNYGNQEYTCVYRVRVHGSSVRGAT